MAARKDQVPTYTAFIGFNTTPEQKALLHDYAVQVGVTPSQVLRVALGRLLLQGAPTPADPGVTQTIYRAYDDYVREQLESGPRRPAKKPVKKLLKKKRA